MKKKLYLITKEFPFGHCEDSFVKLEYPYLQRIFDVTIIMTELHDDKTLNMPVDNTHYNLSRKQSFFEKGYSFLRFLLESTCYREINQLLKTKKLVARRIFRSLMFGTAAETFYRRIKRAMSLTKETDAIIYFYWFDYHCLGLTMHLKKYPHIKVIARTHGYDLYDERELYGRQFFKPQMDKKLQRLIFAAQYAKDYYLSRYQKQDEEKYSLHRLGVTDKYITVEKRKENFDSSKPFLLLSCSHAVALKRVHKIIEGLSSVEAEQMIKWVHIGDGTELNALMKLANEKLGLKKNIQYQFLGNLLNDDVLRYYEENFIGCFITTTETEGGAPVAVQEALSFGVPIIATSIGELPQMVDKNGILLDENPKEDDTGAAIVSILNCYGTSQYWNICQQSLNIFYEKFDEKQNYSKFMQELEELC